MSVPEFTEDQYDAFAEITNLAMGQASAALAEFLDVFVMLTAPAIRVLAVAETAPYLRSLDEADQEVAAVRQSFFGGVSGEVIALHGLGRSQVVADLVGLEGPPGADQEREVLLDVSNMLVGAVVNGIWNQLGLDVGFAPPSLLHDRIELRRLEVDHNPAWRYVLLCEVHFQLEEREFSVRLLIFLPDESFVYIRSSLDQVLEESE